MMKFTPVELRQLLAYVNDRDDGISQGWYYGNKARFEKRHARIRKIIMAELYKPKQSSAASNGGKNVDQ